MDIPIYEMGNPISVVIFYFKIFKKPLNISFFTLLYVRYDDDRTR